MGPVAAPGRHRGSRFSRDVASDAFGFDRHDRVDVLAQCNGECGPVPSRQVIVEDIVTLGGFDQRALMSRLPELLPVRVQNAAEQDLLEGPQAREPEDLEMKSRIELDDAVLITISSGRQHLDLDLRQAFERFGIVIDSPLAL